LHQYSVRPLAGNALRVSSSLGFRVPPVRKIARQSALRMSTTLQPVTHPRALSVGGIDFAKAVRHASIAAREVPPQLPAPRDTVRSNAFPARGAQRVEPRIFRDSVSLTPRLDLIRWNGSEPRLRIAKLMQSGAGFARRNGSRFFQLQSPPQARNRVPHLNELAFLVRDEELRVPVVPYSNVLAAAIVSPGETPAAAPAAPAPPPPAIVKPEPIAFVKHEEHFDAGWDNWVGGVADWKVDVAGVRTGLFALYLPTLEMSDYDLEFLARIDAHTLHWVVRAAGRDSYYPLHADRGRRRRNRIFARGGARRRVRITSGFAAAHPRQAAHHHHGAHERRRPHLLCQHRKHHHRFLG